MTCTHIRQVVRKINELIGKIGNENGEFYENLGTYYKKEDVEILCMRPYEQNPCTGKKTFGTPSSHLSFKRERNLKTISEKVLGKYLSEIGGLINDCNCSISKEAYEEIKKQ